MLGLLRHTVKLDDHNSNWSIAFIDVKKELTNLIGNYFLAIEHIGSTSIKNIPAKPILDIAVAINDSSVLGDIQHILLKNSYIYRGDSGDEGGHLFIKESSPEVRTHHIHFVNINDVQWSNYIFFRDKLNSNRELALAYARLKKKLEIVHTGDRLAYTNAKNDFIKAVLSENIK